MAQKKKANKAAPSAKAAVKKGARTKTVAAAKKPGRSQVKSKPVATKKTVAAKPKTVAKSKKPAAKTAGTAAAVKSKTKTTKPVAKAAPKASTKAVIAKVAAARRPAAAQSGRAVAAAVKTTGQKITAPVAPAKPAAQKAAAPAPVVSGPKKPVSQRHGFKASEYIVYPAHGVGKIIAIEEQEIAGMALELFVINFEKEKLTLRVPTGKLESVGMRKLADEGVVKKAMDTLKGRARVKRTMWSRRAQEYVAKINSGDLISIAEVVRDLYRSEAQPEQSYSERQLYEDALDRMARELAAVEKLDERGAVQRITDVLSKSARGRRMAAEAEAEAEAEANDGGDAETKAA